MSNINKKFAKFLDEHNISYQMEFVLGHYSYDLEVGNKLVEINPTYTHSTIENCFGSFKHKEDHYKKSLYAKEQGYICICVWDWSNWDDILNLISKTSLQMIKTDTKLYYSKRYEKVRSINPNDTGLIEKSYLPIYDDGFDLVDKV